MGTTINHWNVVYRHVEDGKWVARISESFDNKQDAIRYIQEKTGEHFELIPKDKLLKDSQYKPF